MTMVVHDVRVGTEEAIGDPYSTLEVNYPQCIERDSGSAPMTRPRSGLEKIIYYDGKTHKEAVVTETAIATKALPEIPKQPTILGFRRQKFTIVAVIAVVIIVASALGGSLGSVKIKKSTGTGSTNHGPLNPNQGTSFENNGLAVLQWTDPNGTLYKSIYYQNRQNKIAESSWNNSTSFDAAWQIHVISEAVKPATPIAAVAGWPHASYNYSLVKNVYYMSPDNELTERQAKANDSQDWEDDNFTGLFSGSDSTFLASHWCQNILNSSQELVVLFQRDNFENGITQARYTSANDSSNPWVANNFPFAQPRGVAFAMSLVSYRSGKHLMLYAVGDNNKVNQYEYTINDNVDSTSLVSLTSQSATPLTIDPRSSLAVVAQDNQPLFSSDTLPECYQQKPLTNLIIYTSPDRSSLHLSA